MSFVFRVTPCDADALLPQVSLALQQYTEQTSREECPRLWAQTDKLRALPKVPQAVSQKRKVFRRIYSVILLFLGIFLLVPSVMDLPNMILPFIISVLSIGYGLAVLLYLRNPFMKPAKRLLQAQTSIVANIYSIVFTDEQMEIHSQHVEDVAIAYADFTHVYETTDVFLLIYAQSIILLQKEDLQEGALVDFITFLHAQVNCIVISAI